MPSRAGGFIAMVVVASLACDFDKSHDEDDVAFREDVLACEDAVARLASCCPDFDAHAVECNYHFEYDEGCGTWTNATEYPSLTVGESACIRAASCKQLASADVCGRAARAKSRIARIDGDGGNGDRHPLPAPAPTEKVCP